MIITEVFNVIKLEKIVKKTFDTTSTCDSGCFSRDYNETSSQLKKCGQLKVLANVFFCVVHFMEQVAQVHYIYKCTTARTLDVCLQ